MQYIFKYLLCHTSQITVNGRAHMEQQRHLQYPSQYIVRTVEKIRLRRGTACAKWQSACAACFVQYCEVCQETVLSFKSLIKRFFYLIPSDKIFFRELFEKHSVL